jgi:hypothetical protein
VNIENQAVSPQHAARKIANEGQSPSIEPVFVRLPKAGTLCIHSGLSRAVLFRLIREGTIESRVLKRPGTSRGCRLVSYRSLVQFLHALEATK